MKKQHPYYYKLQRISKTTSLLSTMCILSPHGQYVKNLKPLIDQLETAILCCKESESFYKSKNLLKD